MSRTRLLVSAEPFGFGPVGKLMSILEQIKDDDYDICFLGCGTALTAAELNKELFSKIIELDVKQLERYDFLFRECDAVLSVMEPSLVIMGFAYNKKTFYVDSLAFLWDPDLEARSLESVKSELIDRPTFGYEIARSIEMHDSQALAHYLAGTSFVQQYGDVVSRKVAIPNMVKVQAIVPYFPEPIGIDRCDLLVSLSGQLSVFSSPESSLSYVLLIMSICEKILEKSVRPTKIDIAVNPKVLSLLPEQIRDRLNFCSLSHKQMNEKIKSCKLVLAPPGLTTALESIFLGTPYILLPDQHYAHHLNRRILDPYQNYGPMNFDLHNLPGDPHEATTFLQKQAADMLEMPERLSLFVNSFANQVLRIISETGELNYLRHDQRENFDDSFAGFNGAMQIRENMREYLSAKGTYYAAINEW